MNNKNLENIKAVPKTKEIEIAWPGPEFIYYPKTTSWYITIIMLALGIAGFFIWQKQYISAGTIVVIAIAMIILARAKPKIIQYTLNSSGITFKNKTRPLTDFKSFWIVEGDVISTLYLEKTGKLSSPTVAYITQIDPNIVREFLKTHMPEKEGGSNTLNEGLSRFLRI